MAELVFSVTTQAEDAKACQEQNSRDLANVISFLKGFRHCGDIDSDLQLWA